MSIVAPSFIEHVKYELAEHKAFLEANTSYKKRRSNVATDKAKLELLKTAYEGMKVDYDYVFTKEEFKWYNAIDSYKINDMFSDAWDDFLLRNPDLNIRDVVTCEVEKSINCKNPSLGHVNYYCEDCDKVFTVAFTCKSKFCTSCGIKYQMDRALSISEKLIDCIHRHAVFTIPEELRIYFRTVPKLVDVLFKAVEDTLLYMFNEINKSKNFVPGIILTLHTFGRDLKWNPHIHALVTEGGSAKNPAHTLDSWRIVTHFNYTFLRKSFQKTLLDRMKEALKEVISPKGYSNFKRLVNTLYRKYTDGFYVRAEPDYRDGKGAVKYLIRYFNRPAMASSRILFYDGDYVVYYYQRHEDDLYVMRKVHVDEFIKMLIIHIPEKNFKMLRYAGIYASNSKCPLVILLQKKLSSLCISIMRQKANWRDRIIANFNRDPLICPHCKKRLEFLDYYIAPRAG